MTYHRLTAYLQECTAFDNPLLVAGHPATDTDAAISSLFEAWRLTMTGTPAIPVLQGALSRETAFLLGDLRFPTLSQPRGKWVLTDHHDAAAYDGEVVAIIDHHPVSPAENLAEIDVCIRPVGAATTIVVQRIRHCGIAIDAACARILLGAVLLDTEGLSPHKARAEDVEAATWLSALCGAEVAPFYEELKEQLLAETDVTVLYERDFRAYTAADGTPMMGFAILKVRRDHMPDRAEIRHRLAADAAACGYAATVAKIVQYAPDDSREEYYLAAGPAADSVLTEVLTHSGAGAVRTAPDEVYLPNSCFHWGRKYYAVKLVEILQKKE